MITLTKETAQKLQFLRKFFDVSAIARISISSNYISDYYRINRYAYSIFHSSNNLIHMGISRDGKYKESDLLESPNIVAKYIEDSHAKKILELACGRGGNSLYLGKKFPDASFVGIDSSNEQLAYAVKHAKKMDNIDLKKGDYHDLALFPDNQYHIVFIIEAFCHSTAKEEVFKEVWRILRPNGLFIVIDGYSRVEDHELDQEAWIAKRLVEVGMALPRLECYSHVVAAAKNAGFVVLTEEDVSSYVLPNLKKFEHLAARFYLLGRGIVLLNKLLPPLFLYNSIAGYLLPDLIEARIGNYMITVFKKCQDDKNS